MIDASSRFEVADVGVQACEVLDQRLAVQGKGASYLPSPT